MAEKEVYGYFVNSDGFVWNKKHTKPLNGKLDKDGYRTLFLIENGKRRTIREHRLIALCFVNNPHPDKYDIVNHIDGNKQNNSAVNLEWTDNSGNICGSRQCKRFKHLREVRPDVSDKLTNKETDI